MDKQIEFQNDNKMKAIKAFNEFIDCFVEANPEYRDAIGKEAMQLMIIKSNTDEDFNRRLKRAINLAEQIRNMTKD